MTTGFLRLPTIKICALKRMSCSSVFPTVNNDIGGTLQSAWPQGLSRSNPMPKPISGSQYVPIVPGGNAYYSSQYTAAKDALAQMNSASNIAVATGKPIQFRSQEERIKYLRAQFAMSNY
jgi:hypothetical protein